MNASGVVSYLHADRLGSIVAVSDSTGAVLSKAAYGPNGENVPPGNLSIGFSGQRYDAETGLYYYKNRYYSPSIGRFPLQTDPVDSDLNPYRLFSTNGLIMCEPSLLP
ncbi:MAG TPA: RHS repeat-associated core domain-containing protein [Oculatellaceae cyanobacterium]